MAQIRTEAILDRLDIREKVASEISPRDIRNALGMVNETTKIFATLQRLGIFLINLTCQGRVTIRSIGAGFRH